MVAIAEVQRTPSQSSLLRPIGKLIVSGWELFVFTTPIIL